MIVELTQALLEGRQVSEGARPYLALKARENRASEEKPQAIATSRTLSRE